MGIAGTVALLGLGLIALRRLVPLGARVAHRSTNRGALAPSPPAGPRGLGLLPLAALLISACEPASTQPRIQSFDPAQHKGDTGQIVLAHKGRSELVVQDTRSGRVMRLSTTDGVLVAPAGTYRLVMYRAIATDQSNREWSARCSLRARSPRSITVQANGSQKLDVGPPFKARIEARRLPRDQVYFSFKLTGCGGHDYQLLRGGRRAPAPQFQVTDGSGRVVSRGTFRYG